MSDSKFDILIVGVGGQGVLLASEIISQVAMDAGLDIKKSEVHGMSQRGGVVSSHVKIAEKVYSPVINHGQADVMISFEQAEGLRAADWLKKDGLAVVSRTRLVPAIVTSSKDFSYPDDPISDLQKKVKRMIPVDADSIALELGNPRLVNTILLGVLSNYTPFGKDQWIEAIKKRVKPKFVDINLTALDRGRKITLETAGAAE
ncbi:MAG: indolepyruvate oxidoreductase subunit beta [candidate division Zixibacteria bacterium]|nr:indolepyruvate oxidoreductase subunit beta [candidate division Zixibacteria bacterium]